MSVLEIATSLYAWMYSLSSQFTLQSLHPTFTFLYNTLSIPIVLFSTVFYLLGVYGFRKSRAEAGKGKPVKKWPFVTIQIPTYNEIVALRCAKRCLRFNYPKNRYEIIIGDDSSDRGVSAAIDRFAKGHKGIVKVTRRGSNVGFKPGNLNHMLKFTKGEFIVVFDSDFTPHKRFLKSVIAPMMADKRVACAQAKWQFLNMDKNLVSKFASSILMVYHNLLANINSKLGVSLLFGSGQAVRTSALKKLGGWKDFSMTEDVDFSVKALRAGYKTVYLSDLSIPGEVPFTLKGFCKQQKRWAHGNACVFKDNFRWILSGKNLRLPQRLALMVTLLGYASSPFLVFFMATGLAVWFSGTPGAIDIGQFASATSWSIFLNSGFIFAGLVAMRKEKKTQMIFSVLAASLTVGIIVSFHVLSGFMKAILGKPMNWYMIEKMGNRTTA